MSDAKDGEWPEKEPQSCPKCGATVTFGFGLAGGGYGPYRMCLEDAGKGCDWFVKKQLPPEKP